VAGNLDPAELADSRDAEGRLAAEVLAENGVELARAPSASSWLARVGAYLELHIEQGPRLDDEGAVAAAVDGCVGIERFWLGFDGHASHAGTTPLDRRADAALAAAESALAIEWIADELGGLATTGALRLQPGVATVIAGRAELSVDLRHRDAEQLEQMLAVVRDLAFTAAEKRGVAMDETPIWRIDPVCFDPRLVAAASELAECRTMTSGALHDAAEMARAGVPTAMLFCPSIGGVSHSREEDTREQDLIATISRFGDLATRAMALGA
jgi:N-carbamoyl-L-amino-acid hydrolase